MEGTQKAQGKAAESIPPAPVLALEKVFVEHHDRLWRSLFIYSRSRSIADEALAEAFALAVEKSDDIREPLPWVRRVSFRLATKELRDRRLFASEDVSTVLANAGEDVDWSTVDGIVDLINALWTLSPKQRGALVLRWREGLQSREIGLAMGVSPATVRVHLHRGRRQLEGLLREETT